jgi:hypothetical protein
MSNRTLSYDTIIIGGGQADQSVRKLYELVPGSVQSVVA